jgi:hypothetical protein
VAGSAGVVAVCSMRCTMRYMYYLVHEPCKEG